MVDGWDAGALEKFYLVEADGGGKDDAGEGVILADKAEIVVAGIFGPVAIELGLCGLEMRRDIDASDESQHFFGEVFRSGGVELLEDAVAEEDHWNNSVAGRLRSKSDWRDGGWGGVAVGPIDIEIAHIEGMNVVCCKRFSFRAVRSIVTPPVIETNGLGIMMAGA